MKLSVLSLLVCGFVIAIAEEAKLVIKNPSTYRTIDTTSNRARLEGILGAGVGNVVFSGHELLLNQEQTYNDLRDTLYFGKDTSLYCCAFFPGTLGSLAGLLASQYPGAAVLGLRAELTAVSPAVESLSFHREWPGPQTDKAHWDQLLFRLLPYYGSDKQDFVPFDLSKYPPAAGVSTIAIKVFLKLAIKGLGDMPGTIVRTFLVSYGEFSYIRK